MLTDGCGSKTELNMVVSLEDLLMPFADTTLLGGGGRRDAVWNGGFCVDGWLGCQVSIIHAMGLSQRQLDS